MSNTTDDSSTKSPIFSKKVYDAIKQAAQYWLPGLAVLYAALAGFWGFPKPVEVVGTITAIDTFLGVLLGISAARYAKSDDRFDGTLNVQQSDDGQFHSLGFDSAQYSALPLKDSVTLKVQPTTLSTPPEVPPVS